MKINRLIPAVLALALMLGLAGCNSSKETGSPGSTAPQSGPANNEPVKYVELDDVLDAELYGIGFRNGDVALGLEIQKHLDAMLSDGTAATISQKWFGDDVLLRDQDYIEENKAPDGDNSLKAILDKGKIIVGLDDSYPPMGFRDEANKIVGFDIDLAVEVASRMGVEIEFQPIVWSAKEMELNAGKIDCIWNGMTITDERVANMFFTKAYIANEQIIIVANNSGILSKADLAGKIVGLQEGSSSVDALEKDPIRAKVKQVDAYEDNISAFLDLQAGRIDALVVDSVAGRYMLAQNS